MLLLKSREDGNMNKFIIVEVGSVNTKTYLYEDTLKNLGLINIEFRNNYKLNKRIMESDLEKLYEHIESLKEYHCPIYYFNIHLGFFQVSERTMMPQRRKKIITEKIFTNQHLSYKDFMWH